MTKSSLNRLFTILTIAAFACALGSAAVKKKVPVAKSASKKSSSAKSSSTKSASSKASSKAHSRKGAAVASSRSRRKGKAPVAQTWRNRQSAPSADRYREIQQALVAKGYLKSEPNGVWDAQSQEAMKQFQTDQKLAPTGKINSPSLIGLGLGPKNNPAPAAAVAPPPAQGESPLTP